MRIKCTKIEDKDGNQFESNIFSVGSVYKAFQTNRSVKVFCDLNISRFMYSLDLKFCVKNDSDFVNAYFEEI